MTPAHSSPTPRNVLPLTAGLIAVLLSACAQEGTIQIQVPTDAIASAELETRFHEQMATLDQFEVFHEFEFRDRREESGITFRHHVVDDAGRTYKAVHYDHGNGVAVADVDGDGHYDIYFVNQIGPNELWRNLGDGRFENITEQAGVDLIDRNSVGAAFADINNNGFPDLFVTTVMGGNVLFENDGQGGFTDISSQAGVDHFGHPSAAVFFDYNRNGLLDLFVTNIGVYTSDEIRTFRRDVTNTDLGDHEFTFRDGYPDAFFGHLHPERYEASILYRNLGDGRFEDVTGEAGLLHPAFSGEVAVFDATGNGYPDIYLANMQGHDVFFENLDGERFVDRTADFFPRTPWGTTGAAVFDYNESGRFDLLLTDMHSDMSVEVPPSRERVRPTSIEWDEDFLRSEGRSIFGNAFFEHREDGTFVEIGEEVQVQNYWPWGPSVGDLNANGYEDVFVASSMSYPFRYGINTVLVNNRGQGFLHGEFILGIEPRDGPMAIPWYAAHCADEDRDHPICGGGWLAKLARSMRGSDTIVVLGAAGTRSAVVFDVDGDGALDIVTNESGGHPQVLMSTLAQERDVRYLQIELEGTRSNRSGLGAVVRVEVEGRTLTRLHHGRSGYLSQSALPLYFGLAEADRVDRIEVIWPSGTRQVLEGPIEINRIMRITEEG